jgi:hypothetical protein
MKPVNWGRVILGGIAAGVVINLSEWVLNEVVMKKENEEAMKALGKSGTGSIAVWILWGFLLGIVAVWIYAAIRTRFGPGPGTAVKAGLAMWILSSLSLTIAFINLGIFPFNAVWFVWTLVEAVVATVLGAWLYKEEAA